MLSSENVRKINHQIQRELRTVESLVASDDKKAAALDRIAKLKELLEPTAEKTPSRKTILKEFAAAVIEAREETRERNTPVDFWEAIFGIRR